MQCSILKAALWSVLILGVSTGAVAQSNSDFGKREYESNCAVCHGLNGQGGGPYASEFMKKAPSDLTTIAQRNGGVFPQQRIYSIIDGTGDEIAAHGPRHMPIWGVEYRAQATWIHPDPEAFARARILALVDYLYRIQKK